MRYRDEPRAYMPAARSIYAEAYTRGLLVNDPCGPSSLTGLKPAFSTASHIALGEGCRRCWGSDRRGISGHVGPHLHHARHAVQFAGDLAGTVGTVHVLYLDDRAGGCGQEWTPARTARRGSKGRRVVSLDCSCECSDYERFWRAC